MMNATEYRVAIEKDIENGICHLCKKPVVDGDPVYTVEMTHWECYENLRDKFNKFFVSKTPTRLFIGIPNGGWLTHIVDGNKALCGHQPKNTARQMKQRGRWHHVVDTRVITCSGCVKSHGRDTL